ncbi:MAG TPA: site-2 protease family protein, partial [Solirubrobacteraceae bacterium]|nr:site-2 protease family protein [Solirubrobacteraceae bacterium]
LGGSSFQLGRILGIRIGVNASWFLILFLFLFVLSGNFTEILGDSTSGYSAAVGAAILFFGSIVLHELGHALAARRSGIEVTGIDLFFFGGVMKMSRDTDTPGKEFFVAVAGPLVTLAIVLVGTAAGVAIAGWSDFYEAASLDGTSPSDAALLLVSFLVTMNAFLLVFNLVPAFPLDGGRIARAAIWKTTGDRAKATRVSGLIGQAFAALLMGYGVYRALNSDQGNGIWLIVLGFLLWQSARGAVLQSAVTSRLDGVTVADIMDDDPVTVPADLPVQRAYEEYFLRYQGWPWFAVVEADGTYAGIAHRAAVESAAHQGSEEAVRELAADSAEVRDDAPLEALLGSEALRRLGALMAVDADGHLRGVVTLEQVSRALQARLAARTG